MRYNVAVNKKYQYVKVYNVLKKTQGNTNAVSLYVAKLVEKYLLKKKPSGS